MAYFNEAVSKVIDAIELTPDGESVMDALAESAHSLGYGLMTEDEESMVWLMVDDALTVAHEDGRHVMLDRLLPTIVDVAPKRFLWCETDVEGYDALLMCDGRDGKTHGYFTSRVRVGMATHVERPKAVDYNLDRFVDAIASNVRGKLVKDGGAGIRIGKTVVDAIEDMVDERLWNLPCVKDMDKFEDGTEVYTMYGAESISVKDWNDFWADYPSWYEKVYMLSNNGEYCAAEVGDMTLGEVEARYNTGNFERVYYTVV